jgi:isoquinoline 1-oxidoreductase beta subunit
MQHQHLMHRAAAVAALSGGSSAMPADADEAAAGLDRRSFLKISLGTGFALGVFPAGAQQAPAAGTAALKPGQQPAAFVGIAPDGTVTVRIGKLDFGQGVLTALPMLVADEMDADWSRVRAELAPAGEAYKDPLFGIQMVGGSTTVKNSWLQYREIGARTRAMLLAAAARQWQLPVAQLQAGRGVVTGPGGRRAGYGELAAAAMAEPVPASVTLKTPQQFKLIGQPTSRIDARAKSTGQQAFGIDLKLPGMRTVLIRRPPVFGAKVASFDAAAAKAVPGVEDVYPVPLDRGATGLAVVADGFWAAHQAREALKVQWDTAGLELADSDELLARYRQLARQPGLPAVRADVSGLAGAPKKIVAEYHFPYLAHTPMEPLNCTLDFTGSQCTVWVGSQFQTMDHAAVAGVLGLKPEQVQLNTAMAGGGFGRRATASSDYVWEAAQVAKLRHAAGRRGPIKLVWTREDDVKGGYYRPMHVHRAEIGYDSQGRVLGWKHTIVGQSILGGTPFEPMMVKDGVDSTMTEGVAGNAYGFPIALDVHHPKVNVPVLWWRSVGHTHTAFVMETLVDEIARSVGADPVAYRRRLLNKHPRHLAALDLAVEKSGYGKRRPAAGRAFGVAVHESFDSVVAYVVEASLADGRPVLHKVTAAVHCNLPVNPRTIEAQVQGGLLMGLGTTLPGAEITLKAGVVQQGNWNDYRVAVHAQMPQVDLHIVPSADPPTGVGEPSLPPLAPAFANAIAALSGKRLRALPFSA